MGILLFELFRNPLFMGILNKWETLVSILKLCFYFIIFRYCQYFTCFLTLHPESEEHRSKYKLVSNNQLSTKINIIR